MNRKNQLLLDNCNLMIFAYVKTRQNLRSKTSRTANLEKVRFDELYQICFWDVTPLP